MPPKMTAPLRVAKEAPDPVRHSTARPLESLDDRITKLWAAEVRSRRNAERCGVDVVGEPSKHRGRDAPDASIN